MDGVLTDGSIFIDDLGNETKRFNVRDGLAIKVWQRLGMKAGVITARKGGGRALRHRLAELGVTLISQGSDDKGAELQQMASDAGVPLHAVAYIGDDWPDLPAMRRAGYPIAVADADPRVLAVATFVTEAPGGRGAVREAVEHLLTRMNLLEQALALYDSP